MIAFVECRGGCDRHAGVSEADKTKTEADDSKTDDSKTETETETERV